MSLRRSLPGQGPTQPFAGYQFTPTQIDATPLLAAAQSYVVASVPLAAAWSQNFFGSKEMQVQPLVVMS